MAAMCRVLRGASRALLSQHGLAETANEVEKARKIILHNDLFVFESRGDLGEDFTIEFEIGRCESWPNLYHLAASSSEVLRILRDCKLCSF